MNYFDKAYKLTMKNEGGYSNLLLDRGGETYKGISRYFHPLWEGWEIIDDEDFNNPQLEPMVRRFYKWNYWNKVNLTKISIIVSKVSLELFDIAVNMGTMKASSLLQRTLNILNRDEKIYDNLIVDSLVGSITLWTIDKYIEQNSEELLLKLIQLMKAKHYIDIVESNQTQEVFIRGWLNRVNI